MTHNNRLIFILLVLVLAPGCINNTVTNKKAGRNVQNFPIFKTKKGEMAYLAAYNTALTLWTDPFEEINIKTSFGSAHIIVSGIKGATPLVLLHGMNASSTMWYPNINAFNKKFRVYSIDFIMEAGKSISNGDIRNLDDVIKWYNEIFDHFKFEKFSIIGASRGGWYTINLALASDSRIDKIVLLSPAMTITNVKPKKKILYDLIYNLNPKREKLRKVMETLSYEVDNIKEPFINQFYIGTINTKRKKGVIKMRAFSDKDLKSINKPVLLLIGDHDIINNKKSIEKAKSLFPNLETGIIANSGHFLSLDQAEMVNKRVLEFLSKSN